MGVTSVALPIPLAGGGRTNRMPSGGSTSSSYSQSPAGTTGLLGQSLTSLFPKPDTQPGEVRSSSYSLRKCKIPVCLILQH